MTLFGHELKKLLLTPAIIGFVVLCLAANAIVVFLMYKPPGITPVYDPPNIFSAERDWASEQSERYISKYNIQGANAERIRAKYDKLRPVIEEKSKSGGTLSYYFGMETWTYHTNLFGILLRLVIAEGCILSLFLALLSAGYENIRNTEMTVHVSKKGRRVYVTKLAATLIAAAVCFAVLLAVSLTVFFAKFDFSAVWSAALTHGYGSGGMPLITWHSFTVGGYFVAAIGAAVGVTIVCGLFGFAFGLLLRNSYAAIVSVIAALAALFLLFHIAPLGSIAKGALGLTPVPLVWQSPAWFTEGGEDVIWANFETVGLIATAACTAAMTVLAAKIFKKRELL